MAKPKRLLLDLLKITAIGLAASAAVGAALFTGGSLVSGASAGGLEAAKDGLLLLGALGLFLLAGAIMARGKKPEAFAQMESWRRRFAVIGYKTALAVICLCLIGAAALADRLMR